MAIFIGSQEEFLGFFSGFLRNKVQGMSRKYRDSASKCVACNKKAKLEYAHLRGNGRVEIARNILDKYTKENVVTIDLYEFEAQFEQRHQPIEEHGVLLCRQCHNKYDGDLLTDIDFSDNKARCMAEVEKEESIQVDKMPDVVRMLQTLGKETFIKYYEVFRANMDERSNTEIREAFEKDESWTYNSINTKATAGKRIFQLGLNKEALDIIINGTRIDDSIIEKAKKLK